MWKQTLVLAWLAVTAAVPFNAARAAKDPELQEMVDQLRSLSDKARRERAADRWLLQSLDNLVLRYDWPWRRQLLFENFRDGDYERNPHWEVQRGRFWVEPEHGLRSRAEAQALYPPGSEEGGQPRIGEIILGALLDQALNEGQPGSQTRTAAPAQILLRRTISNAYAIDARFRLDRAGGAGRFALSLLQDGSNPYGYRLQLQTGPQGFVELQRIRGGYGAVIRSHGLAGDPGDGKLHTLSWRQRPDGRLSVLLDGRTLFGLQDKAFRDPYQQLILSHWAGDLTLRSLRLNGTP